jgi:hypothetical protein
LTADDKSWTSKEISKDLGLQEQQHLVSLFVVNFSETPSPTPHTTPVFWGIKSLAQCTGRLIVNVPLLKVSTNSELMSIFFDSKYQVEGSLVSIKLGFKDVIFIMEDVDATSKIVKRCDRCMSAKVVEPQKIDLPMPKSLWRMFFDSASSNCKYLEEQLEEKSEKLKEEAEELKPEVLKSIPQSVTFLLGLGLVGEGVDDPTTIKKLCEEAMESSNKVKDQYSKLDEILSSHVQAIKAFQDIQQTRQWQLVRVWFQERRNKVKPILLGTQARRGIKGRFIYDLGGFGLIESRMLVQSRWLGNSGEYRCQQRLSFAKELIHKLAIWLRLILLACWNTTSRQH